MPDVRPIDANALQRAFDDAHKDKPDYYCCNFLNNAGNPSTEWECIEDMIDSIPVIDAQPVKRGKWRERMSTPYSVKCCLCGYASVQESSYCGGCGAFMRGDNDVG